MSTLQATRNLFTTCAVYEHHLYTESRIHAAACGVCQPEYSDAVYATVVDRGTHITHVQMAEVWNCVCNNGGYANMQSTMPRCIARAGVAARSALVVDGAALAMGGADRHASAAVALLALAGVLMPILAWIALRTRRSKPPTAPTLV